MPFVDPLIECSTRIAFSNAAGVRICFGRTSSRTSSSIFAPASSASCFRRESTAGIAAPPGSVIPRPSVMQAIVDAVPIVMQWPLLREIEPSISRHSSSVMRPARNSS